MNPTPNDPDSVVAVVPADTTQAAPGAVRMSRRDRRRLGARRTAGRGKARRNLGALIAEGERLGRGERLLDDEAHR